MENNKNKKSVKFQGDMLNFCDFIQAFVFTRNHHLNLNSFLSKKYPEIPNPHIVGSGISRYCVNLVKTAGLYWKLWSNQVNFSLIIKSIFVNKSYY